MQNVTANVFFLHRDDLRQSRSKKKKKRSPRSFMTSVPAIFGFSQTIPEKLLSALIIHDRLFAAILHVFLRFSIIYTTEVGVLMASLQHISCDSSRSAWVWTRNGGTPTFRTFARFRLLVVKTSLLQAAARLQIRSQVWHKEARRNSTKEQGGVDGFQVNVWPAVIFQRCNILRVRAHVLQGDMRECTRSRPVWYPPAGPGDAITAA